MTTKNTTENTAAYDPLGPIYPGLNAQALLNEALRNLMEHRQEHRQDHHRGECPNETEVDPLAPSLKETIARFIQEENTQPGQHVLDALTDLAHRVIQRLPNGEAQALQTAIEQAQSIPVERWGQDHWTTLAYIETVCVDQRGVPDRRKVQCNLDRHPELISTHPITGQPQDGAAYPIRLRHGEEIADYDEWDCLNDAQAAGFIENTGTGINPTFRMTEAGHRAAGQLRAHRAAGGKTSTFEYEPPGEPAPQELAPQE